MPTYLVKPIKDEDFYVFYSTVVDAPVRWGTRRQLAAEPGGNDVSDERFERTDRTGSSAKWPDWPAERQPFIYSESEFGIMNGPGCEVVPESGPGHAVVLRQNLRAYCEALDLREEERAAALCEPSSWE